MSSQAIRVPKGLTTEGLLVKRYFARVIDSFLLVSVAFAATFAATLLLPDSYGGIAGVLFIALPAMATWLVYETLLESSRWQATLGKRFLGLKVYNSEGGRLTPRQSALRNLTKDGPFLLFGMLPGAQWLLLAWLGAHLVVLHLSPVSQAIHDRVAHTWVAAPETTIELHIG